MHTDLLTLLIASKHTRFDKEKIKCYDSSAVDGVQLSEAIMPKRPFTTLFTRVHLHLAKCKWPLKQSGAEIINDTPQQLNQIDPRGKLSAVNMRDPLISPRSCFY